MRSKQLDLAAYDTDKIQHHYLEVYDPILAPWVDGELTLLEIGIHRGGSLKLWRDYFPHGRIIGIDLKLPKNFLPGERVQVFEGSQADTGFLSEVAMKSSGCRNLEACSLRVALFSLVKRRQALALLPIRCLPATDLVKQPFRGTASTVRFMFRSTKVKRCYLQAHLAVLRKRLGSKPGRTTTFACTIRNTRNSSTTLLLQGQRGSVEITAACPSVGQMAGLPFGCAAEHKLEI